MYQIFTDNLLIFDDTSTETGYHALNPKLSLSANSAGSLSFTLTIQNAGYNFVDKLTSTIRVIRDDVEYWRGRVITESRNFQKSRSFTCEGALAFLNDSIQTITSGPLTGTAEGVIASLLAIHNGKTDLPNARKIFPGVIDSTIGTVECDCNYNTTYECVNSLVNNYGGIIRIRYANDIAYLDWLKNYPTSLEPLQGIEFGKNLLDFTQDFDMTEFATVVHAIGGEVEDPDTQEKSTIIEEVSSPSCVSAYGRIEKRVDFNDITDRTELRTEATRYLTNTQYGNMSIQISAVDLSIFNPVIKQFDLYDRTHVTSWPHDFDKVFAITGLDIPLDNPGGTTYTFSDADVEYKRRIHSMTAQNEDTTAQLENDISTSAEETKDYAEALNDALSDQVTLDIAAAQAAVTQKLNDATQGFVFIDYDTGGNQAIYISETQISDSTELIGKSLWRWNYRGLGYTANYQGSETDWDIAINMDGEISADFIVTGEMWSDRIRLYNEMIVYNGKSSTAGGKLGYGKGIDDGSVSEDTPGIHMCDVSGNVEVIVTPYGARMSYANHHLYVDSTGVHITGGGRGGVYTTCPVEINGNLTVNGTINGQTI